MKTNMLNRSLWLAGILLTSLCVNAQTKKATKTAYNYESHNEYYRIHTDAGRRIENAQLQYEDKIYKIEWADEKLTSLFVDGEKIAQADWGKYNDAIRAIRQQIKEQVKRNEEQAVRNQEQAKRNDEQAVRNNEQAKRNAEQAVRNQDQVSLNVDQAKRNAEQVQLNRSQEKRNAEQAIRNKAQVRLNEDQAKRNDEQAVRNQEQAMRNQLQAKKNEEQARANEQMIKEITEDLVSDKIIPDSNGLHDMKLNGFGMSINGVKQPDEVFKKYKEKYYKFFDGNFHYSKDGIISGSDN